MPKNNTDYSNTIIYKISCNDTNITDVYVGHTTNFVQRQNSHRQCCENNNSKLYRVIRENGGWSNWSMNIINFYNCKDHYEARQKEQEYFISLKATLNSVEPFPNPTIKKDSIIKNVVNIKYSQTTPNIFSCENCKFKSSKLSDWTRHISTRKHETLTETIPTKKCINCDKVYKSREGLWYHLKKCKQSYTQTQNVNNNENLQEEFKNLTSMVMELIKNNNDFQKEVIDVCKLNSI
jgi:hypothetical protein